MLVMHYKQTDNLPPSTTTVKHWSVCQCQYTYTIYNLHHTVGLYKLTVSVTECYKTVIMSKYINKLNFHLSARIALISCIRGNHHTTTATATRGSLHLCIFVSFKSCFFIIYLDHLDVCHNTETFSKTSLEYSVQCFLSPRQRLSWSDMPSCLPTTIIT